MQILFVLGAIAMRLLLKISLSLFLSLVFFVMPAYSQQRVVVHRLIVSVILPNGIAAPQVIEVKLDSERNGLPLLTKSLVRETRTDFTQLPNGEYIVTVTADNDKYLEPYTERVSLRGSFSITRQINVLMSPKIKMGAETVAPGTIAVPGTVNANAVNEDIPKNARKAFEKGLSKSQQGKSEDAIKAFSEAIRYYPTYIDAINNLAVEYIQLARYDDAAQQLETALKLQPNLALTNLNMGIVLTEKKKFAEAKEYLNKSIEADFRNPLAHFQLGVCAFQLKDLMQAQMEFETVVTNAAQKIPLSRLYLAEIYKRNSRSTDAVVQLENFLKENSADNPYTQVVKEELAKLKKTN